MFVRPFDEVVIDIVVANHAGRVRGCHDDTAHAHRIFAGYRPETSGFPLINAVAPPNTAKRRNIMMRLSLFFLRHLR